MLKNMKLGTKIAVGFGVMLAIAMALGGLATVKMKGVVGDSVRLAEEYAPEALLASELERRVNRTMFAVRGYQYTGEQKFLEDGRAAIGQVKETIGKLEKLAAEAAHLTLLKGAIGEIKQTMTEYERLLAETEKEVAAQKQASDTLLEVAKNYMAEAYNYLKDQNEAMAKEIAEGAGADKLKERLQKITLVNDLIDLGNAARVANLGSRAWRDNKVMVEGIQKIFPDIEKKTKELEPITRQAANKEQLKKIVSAAAAYKAGMQAFSDTQAALERIAAARLAAANKALEQSRNLMRAAGDQTQDIAKQAAASLSSAAATVLVGLAVALIVGVALAVFITRSITGPVRRVIVGLSEGAEEVASAAGQVSGASQSLAEGSSEQAASIEETSSSLEEMSSMTRRNADNAKEANRLMGEARAVVSAANEQMGRLTESMGEITRASEETSKIIKTIDEIAFQTNLLALNAAVEAARAGEAGAGFAVVADEVRNLAMRAAEAARSTAVLIEGTVKKVKDGSELVGRAEEAFRQVAGSSSKAADLVAEIAAASDEQAQGIGQINTAVSELDKVTQQNAANAEESASAAEEMSAQAESMKQMVAELVALAGGKGAGKQEEAAALRPQPKPRKAAAALSRAAGRLKAKVEGRKKADKPAPEAVIPLGEKEFADF